MMRQDAFDLPDRMDQMARQPGKDSPKAAEKDKKAHPCPGSGSDHPSQCRGESSGHAHRRLEDIVSQCAGDQRRNGAAAIPFRWLALF